MTALAMPNFYTTPPAIYLDVGTGPEAQRLERLSATAALQLKSPSSEEALLQELFELAAGSDSAECPSQGIDDKTFLTGLRFVLALPFTLPKPEVSVDPDGELSFDWFGSGGANFSVSLRHDGRLSYAGQFDPIAHVYGTEQFNAALPKRVVEAVRTLD